MNPAVRVGVIADIHGNRWALEAILSELRSRNVDEIVNLGDCVYGRSTPAGQLRCYRSWS